jgi:hypothetical protein
MLNIPQINFFHLGINKCTNSSENNYECLRESEIAEFFLKTPVFFNIFLGNQKFDVYNYTNFISTSIFEVNALINPSDVKYFQIYIREQEMETDNGLFWASITKENCISFDYSQSDSIKYIEGRPFFNFLLFTSKNKFLYRRTYIRLSQVLALIASTAKVIRVLFTVLTQPFSLTKRNQRILNKIFNYEPVQSKNAGTDTSNNFSDLNMSMITKRKYEPAKNTNSSKVGINNMNKDPTLLTLENPKIKEIFVHINSNKNKIEIRFGNVVQTLCCQSLQSKTTKKKYELYNKSLSFLGDALDLPKIIEKIEEHEKLKLVLLNKDQLTLFNFIDKYTISLNNKKEQSRITQLKIYEENNEENFLGLLNYQNKIMNKKLKPSPLDKKLFSFLRNDLKFIHIEK